MQALITDLKAQYGVGVSEILDDLGVKVKCRSGEKWGRGYCPIHDGDSFNWRINMVDGGYKCWSKGCVGNIWMLVAHVKKITVVEALALYTDQTENKLRIIARGIGSLSNIESEAGKESKNLKLVELPEKAKEYLYSRGLNDYIIDLYNIKYNPGNLYNDPELFFWKDRVMVPFVNEENKIITYLGRSVDKGTKDSLKALYLPDTNAGDTLFNIQQAKKKKEVTLVEGWLDALTLQKYGYNAVSCNTTDLSDIQLMQIVKYFEVVNVCFDFDDAGVKGSKKVIDKIRYYINDVFYLDLGMFGKEDLDPGELVEEEATRLFLKKYKQ